MRNALDIFYIMLMLNLPSSEPSEALVKIRVRNQRIQKQLIQKRCVKLAETADK